MMRILFTLILAWGLSSCAFPEPRTPTPFPNVNGDTPEEPVSSSGRSPVAPAVTEPMPAPAFASCDLAHGEQVGLLWGEAQASDPWLNYEHRSAFLGFSPQPGLLAHTGSSVHSEHTEVANSFRYALDGSPAFQAPHLFRHGMDANWLVRLELVSQAVQVKWVVTDEVIFEAPVSEVPPHLVDTHPSLYAALTPQAERLVTVTCIQGSQGDAALVASYELPAGEPGPTALIEDFHCSFFPQGPLVIPTPDAQGLLLTGSITSQVAYVDLLTGESHVRQIPLSNEEAGNPGPSWHNPAVVDLAVHPSSSLVAITDMSGRLRLWSLPALTPVVAADHPLAGLFEPTLSVGILPVNQGTYMPSEVSPVAFSPDGRLIAHVNPEGHIVLRDMDTLAIQRTLAPPELSEENEESPSHWVTVNSARRIVFSPDGSAVAVLFTLGPALYGCTDWTITGDTEVLKVRVEGPELLEVGEPGSFIATHFGTQNVHGHQFFINDVAVSALSMDRTLTWVPEKSGDFKVTVVIDDGFNQGEASMMMKVVSTP